MTTSSSTDREALFEGLGEARSTDYFFLQEQLTEEQLSVLRRVRQFADSFGRPRRTGARWPDRSLRRGRRHPQDQARDHH